MTTSTLYPFIWKIRRVFQQLRNVSDVMLDDLGINASQRAVLEVLSAGEKLSVPHMAKRLNVSRQHIQVLANELLAKELVEFSENPAHKRSPLFNISKSGLRLFTSITEREKEFLSVLQVSFSVEDINTSTKTLETLEELLKSKAWEEK